MTRLHPQLSLDVHVHPAISHMDDPVLAGTLKITGGIHCPVDVHAGAQLTVSVADADGNVIAQALLEAAAPHFAVITDKDTPIGMERITKAKVQT